MVCGPDWGFSQDTGVNTHTLTISAMESFNDLRESGHPFNVPSERQHPTQGSVANHCPGALGCFFRPEERVPPTGPPTPPGLPSRDQPGPTLLSFRSKSVVGCRVVCYINVSSQLQEQ